MKLKNLVRGRLRRWLIPLVWTIATVGCWLALRYYPGVGWLQFTFVVLAISLIFWAWIQVLDVIDWLAKLIKRFF